MSSVLSAMLGLMVGGILVVLAWPFIERFLNWWYAKWS
jgi:hypothetical protein